MTRHRPGRCWAGCAAGLIGAVMLLAAGTLVGGPVEAAAASPARPVTGPVNPCLPKVHLCASDVLLPGAGIPGLPVTRLALNQISAGAAAAAAGVLSAGVAWATGSLVGSARDLLAEPGGFLDTLTRPRLTTAAFLGPGGAYHTVASAAVVLLVGFIFLGVISGLLSGEPTQALFRVVRDTPAAVLAIVGFPWLVDQLIGVTDAISAAVLPSGQVLSGMLNTRVFAAFGGLGAGMAPLLLAILAFLAAVLVVAELLVRNILVHLVVALAPLSFAGIVWPAARPAARKAAETAVAGVLAKLAIYLALKVGLDLAGEHTNPGMPASAAWGSLLLGVCTVMVAAFAPWLVWRLLPHAEAYLVAQGVSRMPARAGMQALQTAYWINMIRPRGQHRSDPNRQPQAAGVGLTSRSLPPPPRGGSGGGRTAPAAQQTSPTATGPAGAGAAARAGQDRATPSAHQRTAATSAPGPATGGSDSNGAAEVGWVRRPRRAPRPGGGSG